MLLEKKEPQSRDNTAAGIGAEHAGNLMGKVCTAKMERRCLEDKLLPERRAQRIAQWPGIV